jgi:hypothetical protein
VIAIKSPLETGMLVCRGCFQRRELSAFIPVAGRKYGVRRRCRVCCQPIRERWNQRRREKRAAQLEALIATATDGPQLDAAAKRVFRYHRDSAPAFRALACRLKAGPFQLDAMGRPIVPPALKLWANSLECRKAEFFCRRKLGLPRLPVQERQFSDPNYREDRARSERLIGFMRAVGRQATQADRLRRRFETRGDSAWAEDDDWLREFDERPASAAREIKKPTSRWTIEDERRLKRRLALQEADDDYDDEPQRCEEASGPSMAEMEMARILAIPPPPFTNAIAPEVEPRGTLQPDRPVDSRVARLMEMTDLQLADGLYSRQITQAEIAAMYRERARLRSQLGYR